LEVAAGVEGELAQDLAGVTVDHPDVEVVDQQGDAGAGVRAADADVVHSAVVSQGDGAGLVDLVLADAALWVDVRPVAVALGRAL
jgi:hypothetical protein